MSFITLVLVLIGSFIFGLLVVAFQVRWHSLPVIGFRFAGVITPRTLPRAIAPGREAVRKSLMDSGSLEALRCRIRPLAQPLSDEKDVGYFVYGLTLSKRNFVVDSLGWTPEGRYDYSASIAPVDSQFASLGSARFTLSAWTLAVDRVRWRLTTNEFIASVEGRFGLRLCAAILQSEQSNALRGPRWLCAAQFDVYTCVTP